MDAVNTEKKIDTRTIEYRSPSNIALVKYWGKMGLQMPMNPSISFTLSTCATTTSVEFSLVDPSRASGSNSDELNKVTSRTSVTLESDNKKISKVAEALEATDSVQFEFFFEGEAKPDFHPKLEKFFSRIERDFPSLKKYSLKINSSNSFPHSSGIASSASAMSALALCIADFERSISENYEHDFHKRASHWARLGSGSACRSVFPFLAMWGYSPEIDGSSDKYALPIGEVAPIFQDFQDTVLLVDKGQKQISSTVGHDLMKGHPYTAARIEQAHNNLNTLLDVMRNGDLENFVKIVENEALSLHAMMLSSDPGYFLIKPNTLKIIEAVREFRKQKGINLCFTLDAGANVHLLYPSKDKNEVLGFVESDLLVYCQNGEYICDSVGRGPERLK